MALQVWLPLNGSLENKGVSDLTFSVIDSSSTTVTEGGKIGEKSYYNNNGNTDQKLGKNGGIISDKTLHIGNNLSMFCWVKLEELNTAQGLTGIGGMHTINLDANGGYSIRTGMGISVYIDGRVSFSWGDGIGAYAYATQLSTTAINTERWHHIGFTCSTSGVNSNVIIYIDGVASGSFSLKNLCNPDDYVHLFSWSRDGQHMPQTLYSGYKPKGRINDFRIYDHCLSPREVKLLSQGLIAHYPLKSCFLPNLLEGAQNYTESSPLRRTVDDEDAYSREDSYMYHNNITTNIIREGYYIFTLNSDGSPFTHDVYNMENTPYNKRYMICFRKLDDGDHPIWQRSQIAANGKHYGIFYLKPGKYDLRTNLYLYKGQGDNYAVNMWNMQLFEYDQFFPEIFEPFSASDLLQSEMVAGYLTQDTSGYTHNADKIATVTLGGPSPQYPSSAKFNRIGLLRSFASTYGQDDITIAAWIYPRANNATLGDTDRSCILVGGVYLTICPDGNQARVETYCYGKSKPGYHANNKQKIDMNKWTHVAAVWDNLNKKHIIYINGDSSEVIEDCYTNNTDYMDLHQTKTVGMEWREGREGSTFHRDFCGEISDIRIYTTPLTENDIWELYSQRNYPQDNGTINASSEFIESDLNTSLRSISELDAPLSNMKIKTLPDGSSWARIHQLDWNKAQVPFSDNEVESCESGGKYSKMGCVERFKGGRLPNGYDELSCIQSNGTQYIDTGVKPNYKTRLQMDFEYTGNLTERGEVQCLFGSRTDITNNVFGMWINRGYVFPHYGDITYDEEGTFVCNGQSGNSPSTINRLIYNFSGVGASVGPASCAWSTTRRPNSQVSLCLFAMNTNGQIDDRRASGKLYSCKIFESERLIRDFVPCRREDMAIGLYDLVEQKFYENRGSESFLVGENLQTYEFMLTYPELRTTLPGEYTQLQYVESNGQQYINTGITRDARWEFDIQFDTSVGHRQLMGYHGNFVEYWGVQASGHYGIHEECNFIAKKAGQRDTIIHNFGDQGKYELMVQDQVLHLLSGQKGGNPEYQLFCILGLLEQYGCSAKLYGCNCVQNGEIVRKFIPARRNLDQIAGLYDLIEGRFYTSDSDTHLIAGEEVKKYTRLEYLQTDGNQYINTNFRIPRAAPSDIFEVEATVLITGYNTNGGREFLFAFDSSSHNHYAEFTGGKFGCANVYITDACDIGTKYNVKMTIHGQTKTVYNINGKTAETSASQSLNWGNFNLYRIDKGYRGHFVRIYHLRMKYNGEIVREYVPVIDETGKCGMLDLISWTLYENCGTGEFVCGDDMGPIGFIEQYNRWSQGNSPNVNYRQHFDYTPIHTDFSHWDGIKYNTGPITKAFNQQKAAYLVNTSNDYQAPIGQKSENNQRIRAANDSTQIATELWIRIDRLPNAKTYQNMDGCHMAPHFIEY